MPLVRVRGGPRPPDQGRELIGAARAIASVAAGIGAVGGLIGVLAADHGSLEVLAFGAALVVLMSIAAYRARQSPAEAAEIATAGWFVGALGGASYAAALSVVPAGVVLLAGIGAWLHSKLSRPGTGEELEVYEGGELKRRDS